MENNIMEKEKYEPVEIEVIEFNTEDLITTSGGNGDGKDNEFLDLE